MYRITGIALIILGIIMFIWTGFTYTRTEKIVDAGPVHISADKQKTVNWPPMAGGVLVLAGVLLVVTAKNKA